MKIDNFIEKNNIAIFVEVDLKSKRFKIVKSDIRLETYDLFEQFVLWNDIESFVKSVKNQLMPRIWSQGHTKCIVGTLNDEKMYMCFYDTGMDAKENYFYAKELEVELKKCYGEI